MSIPIWVTDPAGNNDPFLKILPTTIFIGNIEATFDGNGNFLTTATLYYSFDGVNWPAADISALSGFSEKSQMRQFTYGNGMWMCTFRYTYMIDGQGNHLRKDVAISTTNGTKWVVQATADPNISSTIQITWDSVHNKFQLSGGSTISVPNPNPTPIALFGDFIGHGTSPDANPGTVAVPSSQLLQNKLPGSYTAVRYGYSGNQGGNGTFTLIDLTTTAITSAIVSGSSGWPGATWTSVFDQDPSGQGGPGFTIISPAYGAISSAQ